MLKVIKIKGHAQSGKTTMTINWLLSAVETAKRPQGVLVLANREHAQYVREKYEAKLLQHKIRIVAAIDYAEKLDDALNTVDPRQRGRKLDEVMGAVVLDDANTFDPVTLARIRLLIKHGAKILAAGAYHDPMLLIVKFKPLVKPDKPKATERVE